MRNKKTVRAKRHKASFVVEMTLLTEKNVKLWNEVVYFVDWHNTETMECNGGKKVH